MAKGKKKVEEIKEELPVKNKRNKGFRKYIIIACIALLCLSGALVYKFVLSKDNEDPKINKKADPKLPALPKPEVTEGERGKLGIDKNINETNIDKYLNRSDSVYRDMRMLEDPADYAAIGGDAYLSGYIKGFEVVPLPYIIPVDNLPEEVGYTYQGYTLFYKMSDGSYEPMYKESMKIIEELFPKDKIIFLMCGGGGYAGMMKEFLVANGWDKDKIYNIGGHWYYEGKNNVQVKKIVNGKPKYDFDSVPYHDIDFTELTKIVPDKHDKGDVKPFKLEDKYYNVTEDTKFKDFDDIDPYDVYDKESKYYEPDQDKQYKAYMKLLNKKADYLNNLLKNKESFVLTTYYDEGCGGNDESIRLLALEYAKKHNLYIYDVEFTVYEETDLYKDIQYSPSIQIYKNGELYTYTDIESDEDLKVAESLKSFDKWFTKYVILDEEE
ncbi:MAG: hypothetical protein K6G37_03100 [Bacilli bacterium]|nr:hypothetical protein [Bacilli bacterium]